MLRKLSLLAFTALAISLPASALDVDRIELKSGIGQPLLAEIPIVSADPAELRKLQVRLASPATFARIGLERPHGLVASLQFHVARDARGKPVIRVTSAAPVEQDFLTFLVQADWGDGRLVREYSVSLSAPDAIASPMPPSVELPTPAMAGTSMRAAEPVAIPMVADVDAQAPQAREAPAQPIPLAAPTAVPASEQPSNARAKLVAASPAKPASSSGMPPVPTRERGPAPGDYGPVRAGDMLSKIAGAYVDDRHTLNQAMLAVLRVNPGAFIGGNINLLRRGEILRAPSTAELSRYDAAEAAAMVHEQIRSWREGRPVPPQPAALPALPSPPAKPATKTNPPRVAAARLEISPAPDEIERLAVPQSGTAPSGTGDGLQAAAGRSAESSAMRSAELQELQVRVAELDQLRRDQQALLALKDAELAARSTSRAVSWPWLAAAFGVFLPLAWWLGRRGGRVGTLPAAGDSGWPGTDDSDEGGGNGGGHAADDRARPDGAGQPESSVPGWHSGMRDAATSANGLPD